MLYNKYILLYWKISFFCKTQDMHYFSTINVQQSSRPGVHSVPLVATRVDARKRQPKNWTEYTGDIRWAESFRWWWLAGCVCVCVRACFRDRPYLWHSTGGGGGREGSGWIVLVCFSDEEGLYAHKTLRWFFALYTNIQTSQYSSTHRTTSQVPWTRAASVAIT